MTRKKRLLARKERNRGAARALRSGVIVTIPPVFRFIRTKS